MNPNISDSTMEQLIQLAIAVILFCRASKFPSQLVSKTCSPGFFFTFSVRYYSFSTLLVLLLFFPSRHNTQHYIQIKEKRQTHQFINLFYVSNMRKIVSYPLGTDVLKTSQEYLDAMLSLDKQMLNLN